ncbi:unnamed protein product [Notodromas monacha]|uniref:Uncharacterized protein n=1 Tax=Notodromas monacha TaxID=399045 RepID=A0A7R9BYL9_9CRUS|nr:unnamed protein product [Notodromas monacha]CAG0922540.1 unnamed protein product [Notodromas monacha]
MEEPMLKKGPASTTSSSDVNIIVPRRRRSGVGMFGAGATAESRLSFPVSLIALFLGVLACVTAVWLWRVELPARVAELQERLEMSQLHLGEHKRAIHFLRKEMMFTYSRLQAISAYETSIKLLQPNGVNPNLADYPAFLHDDSTKSDWDVLGKTTSAMNSMLEKFSEDPVLIRRNHEDTFDVASTQAP